MVLKRTQPCCKTHLKVDDCKQSPSSVQERKCADLAPLEFVGNAAEVEIKFSLDMTTDGPSIDQNLKYMKRSDDTIMK